MINYVTSMKKWELDGKNRKLVEKINKEVNEKWLLDFSKINFSGLSVIETHKRYFWWDLSKYLGFDKESRKRGIEDWNEAFWKGNSLVNEVVEALNREFENPDSILNPKKQVEQFKKIAEPLNP